VKFSALLDENDWGNGPNSLRWSHIHVDMGLPGSSDNDVVFRAPFRRPLGAQRQKGQHALTC